MFSLFKGIFWFIYDSNHDLTAENLQRGTSVNVSWNYNLFKDLNIYVYKSNDLRAFLKAKKNKIKKRLCYILNRTKRVHPSLLFTPVDLHLYENSIRRKFDPLNAEPRHRKNM